MKTYIKLFKDIFQDPLQLEEATYPNGTSWKG